MKRMIAIFISVLFFASLSLAVVGCKKEEQKPAEAPKVEAPAATPAPAATAHLRQQLHLLHQLQRHRQAK